eukprot:CAMPEP_0198142980 /NCGR_PEP_ID=MMETSP1443-20131203/5632_1 /TAXON_ID=186043 /ORGANISM="Entomoneis sp., Strain CCMP2396" /LENGTH=66 /DNA_ID=CAMNT_0043806115 /DNA_START=116 /DNA_END=317 /DNA_ORIENTATION=-
MSDERMTCLNEIGFVWANTNHLDHDEGQRPETLDELGADEISPDSICSSPGIATAAGHDDDDDCPY